MLFTFYPSVALSSHNFESVWNNVGKKLEQGKEKGSGSGGGCNRAAFSSSTYLLYRPNVS